MFIDSMVFFTRSIHGVNMYRGVENVINFVQNLMLNFLGDIMTFLNSQLWIHGQIRLCVKPMS